MGDAQEFSVREDVEEQIQQECRKSSGRQHGGQPGQRLCGNCKEPGPTARTCHKDKEMSDVYSSV